MRPTLSSSSDKSAQYPISSCRVRLSSSWSYSASSSSIAASAFGFLCGGGRRSLFSHLSSSPLQDLSSLSSIRAPVPISALSSSPTSHLSPTKVGKERHQHQQPTATAQYSGNSNHSYHREAIHSSTIHKHQSSRSLGY